MIPDNELTGKVALITGAGSDVAEVLCSNYIVKGARLAIHYHSGSMAEQERILTDLQAAGATAFLFPHDVSDQKNITRFLEQTVARFGSIDIAINISTLHEMLQRPYEETPGPE